MNNTLSTTLVNPASSAKGGIWVDLEQEPYEDPSATQHEVAELIDSLYNIDPCNPEETIVTEEQETSIWGAPPQAFFDQTVKEEFTLETCDFTTNNGYTADLNLFLSNMALQYKLKLTVGVAGGKVRRTEEFEDRIPVENAVGYLLKYPVKSGFESTWLNYIKLGAGNVDVMLSDDRRTLSWGAPLTGTLEVRYTTEYYRIQVAIPSNDGDPLTSQATVFCEGLIDVERIAPPDVEEGDDETKAKWCPDDSTYNKETVKVPFPNHSVSCYTEVIVKQLCECTKSPFNEFRYFEVATCPEKVRCYDNLTTCGKILGRRTDIRYVDCHETSEDIHDPEFYLEKCCKEPEVFLPMCVKTYSTVGVVPLSEEVKASYTKQYKGVEVNFIAVKPPDGKCGEHVIKQELIAQPCCDVVAPISFIDANSVDFIPDGGAGVISITEGSGKYTWSIQSPGAYFNGAYTLKTLKTSATSVTIYVEDACGGISVSVTDGCTSATWIIRAEDGHWDDVTSDYADGCKLENAFVVDGDGYPYTSQYKEVTEGIWRQTERYTRTLQSLIQSSAWCYFTGTNTFTEDSAPQCIDEPTWSAVGTCEEFKAMNVCADADTGMYNYLQSNTCLLYADQYHNPNGYDVIAYCNNIDGPIWEYGTAGLSCTYVSGGTSSGIYKPMKIGQLIGDQRKVEKWVC